jgi:NADH-quinone oxidoreductase subunit M
VGAWQASPAWALAAALGVVVAAAFTLKAIHVSFFGERGASAGVMHDDHHPMPPISWPEKTGALILLGVTILIGLKPGLLLDWILPALESPAFEIVMGGGR